MCKHRHPDPAGARENRSEYDARDRGLLDTGQSLLEVVQRGKQSGREQNHTRFGPSAGAEKLAEAFEQVASKQCLLPEPSPNNHGNQQSKKRGRVSNHEVVSLIDRRSAQQRHHYRLQQDFKNRTEGSACAYAGDPALGWRVTDFSPRRARPSGHASTRTAPRGAKNTLAARMTRIADVPSGPKPRRLVVIRSERNVVVEFLFPAGRRR